jgi:hypothetical protein
VKQWRGIGLILILGLGLLAGCHLEPPVIPLWPCCRR